MAKIDEEKEFIGYLKVLLSLSMAIAVSLIVWIFNHFNSLSFNEIMISFVVFVMDLIVVLFINYHILKKIKGLRKL